VAKIRYKNASYHTCGELPAVGSCAPDVSLVNTDLQNVSFANFMGMRKVLNIFASIDRGVCAKSVIRFNELAGQIEDVAMLMVSYDLPFAHRRFQEEHGLTLVLAKTMACKLSMARLLACSAALLLYLMKTIPLCTKNRSKISPQNLITARHSVRLELK